MKIIISRIYGNVDFTIGIATIEGCNFRCYTLERRSADHSSAANKRNNHAMPCGDYEFKLASTRLSPMTPRSGVIKGYGRITIVKTSSFDNLGTGDIAFFSSYPDKGFGSINESIYKTFESLCYAAATPGNKMFHEQKIFSIREVDDFYYDENYNTPVVEENFDQDFIEDDVPFE